MGSYIDGRVAGEHESLSYDVTHVLRVIPAIFSPAHNNLNENHGDAERRQPTVRIERRHLHGECGARFITLYSFKLSNNCHKRFS